MVAQEYLKLSDTKLSFYDKWCLAKQLDKHYDTTIFLKTFNTIVPKPPSPSILPQTEHEVLLRIPLQATIPLPELAPMTPCRKEVQSFFLTESASYFATETRGKSQLMMTFRVLPCLGCQRNQDCNDQAIALMVPTHHHLTFHQPSNNDTTPVFVFYENGVIRIESQITSSIDNDDVLEIIARYNLERFLE